MSCLGSETVALYVVGGLTPHSRARADAHVDLCPSCRNWIARAARMATRTGSSSTATSVHDGIESLPTPGVELGRYRVRSVLGRGAMGVVLLAEDPALDREVAIKLLHRAVDDDTDHAALLEEARNLARLSDPHVVQVFDVGTWCGRMFLAMELVRGRSLRQACEGAPLRARLRMLLGAGLGLAAAHAVGIVHRDFKPENVLASETPADMQRAGDTHRVKVGDFGLARALAPEHSDGEYASDDESIAGTPAYMAPEQLVGGVPDPRADQYAFCVTAVELLLGFRPRPITSSADSLSFAAATRRLPRGLGRALARGLALDPRDRYVDMQPILSAIERASSPRLAPILWAVPIATILALAWPREAEPASIAVANTVAPAQSQRAEVEALLESAARADRRGDTIAAHAALEHAWSIAREHQLDVLAGRAAIAIARLEASDPDRGDSGLDWLRQAESVLDSTSPQRARVAATRARLHVNRGELAEARRAIDDSLERFVGAAVPAEERADALLSAYDRQVAAGQAPVARDVLEDTVETWCMTDRCSDSVVVSTTMRDRLLAEHGPDDHRVSAARVRLGFHLMTTMRYEEARTELELALAALERDPRADPLQLALATQRLASVNISLGRNAPAYELARLAVDRVAHVFGPDSPNLIGATMALAQIESVMGATATARQRLEWALVASEELFGTEHPMIAVVLTDLATLAQMERDRPRARLASERAMAVYAARYPGSPGYAVVREIHEWSLGESGS